LDLISSPMRPALLKWKQNRVGKGEGNKAEAKGRVLQTSLMMTVSRAAQCTDHRGSLGNPGGPAGPGDLLLVCFFRQ
jgi:hypothetical protein